MMVRKYRKYTTKNNANIPIPISTVLHWNENEKHELKICNYNTKYT